jgi:hypothetical protein
MITHTLIICSGSMNSKTSSVIIEHKTANHKTPFDALTQKVVSSANTEIKEAQMTFKTLITTLLLSSTLFIASEALAKPDMTPEQLAKAKETARQMKPTVDLDVLFTEADRLKVECEGDLTTRIVIKTCKLSVETAQSEERQAKIKAERKQIQAETTELINQASDLAQKKLDEIRAQKNK